MGTQLLPPVTEHCGDRSLPKRPLDPVRVPEPVGLVSPTWLPYKQPLPSPRWGEVGRRIKPERWSGRHHICESKDNRRLPRPQRSYFDDLPQTRCQGGDYHMVPGHRSRNFDHFCSAPSHNQLEGLEKRFERYPFLELESAADSSSAGGSCRASPDARSDSINKGAAAFPVLGKAKIEDMEAIAQRMDLEELPDESRELRKQAGISMPSPSGDACASGRNGRESRKSRCSPHQQFMHHSEHSPAHRHSAHTCSHPLSGMRSWGKLDQHPRGAGGMSKYSILARSGLPQFHAWSSREFGSMVRLWRCLDVHNNMRIGREQFLRGLRDFGYSYKLAGLFKVLNRDMTGTLLFYHFAPEAALQIAELLVWARARFGSILLGGLSSAVYQRGKITRKQFFELFKKEGFVKDEALQFTFDLVDKDGDGRVVREEVAALDQWEFPEWLTVDPDIQAAEACMRSLLEKSKGNALLAWRELDRNGSMRVAWLEFRQACRRLLPPEELEKLPAVWRALDKDLSGWLSLREFDTHANDMLTRLINWVHEMFGTMTDAFQKLGNPEGKISYTEFRQVVRPSGFGDDSITYLFNGLDMNRSNYLTIGEVRFLDQWQMLSDHNEEEAWAKFQRDLDHKNSGGHRKHKSCRRSRHTVRRRAIMSDHHRDVHLPDLAEPHH